MSNLNIDPKVQKSADALYEKVFGGCDPAKSTLPAANSEVREARRRYAFAAMIMFTKAEKRLPSSKDIGSPESKKLNTPLPSRYFMDRTFSEGPDGYTGGCKLGFGEFRRLVAEVRGDAPEATVSRNPASKKPASSRKKGAKSSRPSAKAKKATAKARAAAKKATAKSRNGAGRKPKAA